MNPLDPDLESLVREWIGKPDADLEAAEQLLPKAQGRAGLREIVAFHCRQTIEKYLKAFLTYHQIDFPKTHSIRRLLRLADHVNNEIPEALRDAAWLTPFGVDARYPDDAAEMLPGGETKAVETARAARDVVLRLLSLKL